ncbi:MAG TPA: hypothetical protein VNF73_13835 [Candidatus Saccharimonadales bacterium]|nr:hypothetical protein [Candidatus Saccharimonadales bacterium]
MRRFRAGFFVVLAAVILGACSTKPQTVTAPPGSAGADATPIATGSATGDLGTYPMGARVSVGTPAVAQIQVAKYEKNPPCKDATAGSGDLLIGVSVEYIATQPLPYALADWTARSDNGTITASAGCFKDILATGSASAGKKVGGWVLLQVPTSSKHLWVTYSGAAGAKIVWQLY